MDQHQYVINWNKNKWELKNNEMYANSGSDNQWPWYCSQLDPDIDQYLLSVGKPESKILDLGTCSGAQALALAKKGYNVVGSDISETAIAKANESKALEAKELTVEFVFDDIIESKLPDNDFDFVFDRGCFHCICYFGHKEYIENIHRILKPNGVLLLKVMSDAEVRFQDFNKFGEVKVPMPAHLSNKDLNNAFAGPLFDIEQISDSYFYSNNINPPAKARLAIIRRR